MKVTVTKVWERKEIAGKNGKNFTAQNLYAKEGDNDITINALSLEDLSYLNGKEVVLEGSVETGEYNGKKTVKIGKKTIIKQQPVGQDLVNSSTPNVASVVEAGAKERLLELYNYFSQNNVPSPEAQALASTVFIQENRK